MTFNYRHGPARGAPRRRLRPATYEAPTRAAGTRYHSRRSYAYAWLAIVSSFALPVAAFVRWVAP